MATTRKGRVLRQDQNNYDGVNLTGTRADSTGGTYSGLKVGDEVDILTVYGSGTAYTLGTIQAAVRAIGSSNRGLKFAPGSWVISDNYTIPSNFSVILAPGATLEPASGKTLTIAGPLFRYSSTYTGGAGTVTASGFDSMGSTSIYADYAADTGAADAYVIAPSPAIGSYSAGQRFRFRAGNSNTGASTLAVSGLTAKAIVKNTSTALVSGDIIAGRIYTVNYDSTSDNFELQVTQDDHLLKLSGGTMTGAIVPASSQPGYWLRATHVYTYDGTDIFIDGVDQNNASSSTTWTKASWVRAVRVTVVGGGGGGGGANSASSEVSVGGGGGGGGTGVKFITSASLGATETITVGAKGAGGTAGGAGGNGSTSSFGSHVTASGGTGSSASSSGTSVAAVVAGVAGGIGASGDYNIRGGPGGGAIRLSGTSGISGAGGNSTHGGGGAVVVTATAGNAGTGYGAGGSGACSINNTDTAGGDGSAGIVIVEEFE